MDRSGAATHARRDDHAAQTRALPLKDLDAVGVVDAAELGRAGADAAQDDLLDGVGGSGAQVKGMASPSSGVT